MSFRFPRGGRAFCAGALLVAFASLPLFGIEPGAEVRRVVCLGDSITHGGYYEYYLQLFECLRHPGSAKRYFNAGYSGGTLETGLANLAYEIDRVKPDCAFVMFGMNDVGWTQYGTNDVLSAQERAAADRRESDYRARWTKLIAAFRSQGVTNIVLVTPTPYDEYSTSVKAVRRRQVTEYGLRRLAQAVRDVARDERLPLVEVHEPLTQAVRQHPEEKWCGTDRVHPGRFGHLFMAWQYLKAMGADKPVAEIALSSDGTVKRCVNARVENVSASSEGLSFDYEPAALPLPRLTEYDRLGALYPAIEDLNRERLAVRGLAAGNWRLMADGREIGVYSARQLADGVNLAACDTPNRRVAEKAGAAMVALHDFDVPRRYRACARLKYLARGADLDDRESVRAVADRILAELREKKSRWLAMSENTARLMTEAAGKGAEIAAEEDRLYRQIEAVRPVRCRMEVRRVLGEKTKGKK